MKSLLFLAGLMLVVPDVLGATFGVTVPTPTTMTYGYIPYATNGTQIGGNSPIQRLSSTKVLLPSEAQMRSVDYIWPGSQGVANSMLFNNGSGLLNWTSQDTYTGLRIATLPVDGGGGLTAFEGFDILRLTSTNGAPNSNIVTVASSSVNGQILTLVNVGDGLILSNNVVHGSGTGYMRMTENWTPTASGEYLTIQYTGTNWYEIARSPILNAAQVVVVPTLSAALALTPRTGVTVNAQGRVTANDGGGGIFNFVAGGVATTNLGTIFNTSGGFQLVRQYSGPVNVKWFGAVGAGVSDDSVAIQNALDSSTGSAFGSGLRPVVYLPMGRYLINTTLSITNPVVFQGDGVELNSVNVEDYLMNGSVLVSGIVDSTPVIHCVGRDVSGTTYLQGVEIRNIGIDGTGTDGAGIQLTATGNSSDLRLENILVRRVGGSAFKAGDGTLAGSPRILYSRFKNLIAIQPGIDGLEFYSGTMSTVDVSFEDVYVNSPGRNSIAIVNMGNFFARNFVCNNSAQSQAGNGLYLRNIDQATFINCFFEGDGRAQASGVSYVPTFSASAMRLEGVSKSSFISCVATSPAGSLSDPLNSGVMELVSSASASGFSARDTMGNKFVNCRITGFTPNKTGPSAAAVGSGGALSSGQYRYRVGLVYNSGSWETPITACTETVVAAVSNDSVNLTAIPTGSSLGGDACTARKIYRTDANGTTYKLLATIADNVTTTYLDTIADASLGAQATTPWLIFTDSVSGLNVWDGTLVNTAPLVKVQGTKNSINNGIYVNTISPVANPSYGTGSFDSTLSSGSVGTRHYFGGDSAGFYANSPWLTASTEHKASFLLPSFGSSRFGQNQSTILESTATSSTTTVNVGGGHASDLAATSVGLWAGGSIGTVTGTRQANVTSSGVGFNNHATMDNNLYFRANNSGGSALNLAGIRSDNIMEFGPGGTTRITMKPGTGGLYLGDLGTTASIWVPRVNTASAGNPLRNSQTMGFVGSYWNGAAEVQQTSSFAYAMTSTNPVSSLLLKVADTDHTRFTSAGNINILAGKLEFNGGASVNAVTNTPEGALGGTVGSIALRTDGSTGTTLYVKESGTGNTGWVAVSTTRTGSATLDFPNTGSNSSSDLEMTVTGAREGDPVSLPGSPPSTWFANTSYSAFCSTTNDIVVIRFNNYSGGPEDPSSATFKVVVHKF